MNKMKRTIYKYLFRLIMMMNDMQFDVKLYLDIMMIKSAQIDYLHLLLSDFRISAQGVLNYKTFMPR